MAGCQHPQAHLEAQSTLLDRVNEWMRTLLPQGNDQSNRIQAVSNRYESAEAKARCQFTVTLHLRTRVPAAQVYREHGATWQATLPHTLSCFFKFFTPSSTQNVVLLLEELAGLMMTHLNATARPGTLSSKTKPIHRPGSRVAPSGLLGSGSGSGSGSASGSASASASASSASASRGVRVGGGKEEEEEEWHEAVQRLVSGGYDVICRDPDRAVEACILCSVGLLTDPEKKGEMLQIDAVERNLMQHCRNWGPKPKPGQPSSGYTRLKLDQKKVLHELKQILEGDDQYIILRPLTHAPMVSKYGEVLKSQVTSQASGVSFLKDQQQLSAARVRKYGIITDLRLARNLQRFASGVNNAAY